MVSIRSIVALAILLPVCAARLAFAVSASESPAGSDAEARLLADAADGRLDDHTLLRAALIVGGTGDPQVWSRVEGRLSALAQELQASGRLVGSMAEQARTLHQFLHRRVLTGEYDANANDVAEVFRNGRYNCISASTIFLALAGKCALPTAALELPAHVLVVVDPQGAAVRVETTLRGQDAIQSAANVATRRVGTMVSLGAGSSTSRGRMLQDAQILATFYHNRGVVCLAERDYPAAIAANRAALLLDSGCAAARQNLLAAWNNWALALADIGEYTAALEKIDAGLAVSPGYEPLLENRIYIESRRRTGHHPGRSSRSALRVGPIAPKFH